MLRLLRRIFPIRDYPRVNDTEFEDLVRTCYQDLYRFALSLARNEADACDLTQQTFYRYAERGHQVRDRAKLKGWLVTTLHRLFLAGRRHETSFPQVAMDDAEADLPVTRQFIFGTLPDTRRRKPLSKEWG